MVRPSILACAVVFCGALTPAVGAEPTRVATNESGFRYTLRAGETLSDVARLFQLPVDDLMRINGIRDPDRLAVGRSIAVPNAFAAESARLRTEQARLLEARQEAERNATRLEARLAATEADLHRLEGEREALAATLAATAQWRMTAMLLGVLSLGVFAWLLVAHGERLALDGRLRRAKADLDALAAAKERYRQAVAQLELRYQNLDAGIGRASREVTDGARRLLHVFEQGAAQLDRRIAEVRADREREEHRRASGRRARDVVFHPVREWLARHRFKYRVP